MKDVLYIFEFKPNSEHMKDSSLLEDSNIHYFEFGVTSNIRQRQRNYGNTYRLDNIFSYDSGFKASLAEEYIKKIVYDMDLKLNYKNKIECMFATYKELEIVYKLISEHNYISKNKNSEKKSCDIDEYANKKNRDIEIEKLKNNANLIKLMKDGIITFEQFKECYSS